MACLRETFYKWLKLNGDAATWRVLEVALTNVKFGHSTPGHGKDVYFIVGIFFFFNAISHIFRITYLAACVSKF